MANNLLFFNSNRRFGVEFEANAFDKRDFVASPLEKGELPVGIDYVGLLVQRATETPVEITKYKSDHHNSCWVVKPDRSCGIEVCSPVSKGWPGLSNVCKVVEAFSSDTSVVADERCGLHVHLEVSDCSRREIATVLSYWIKCEAVFLDSVPSRRKKNSYSQCIGANDGFQHNSQWNEEFVIDRLGKHKYFTMNCWHLKEKHRKTIEVRIGEHAALKDPYFVKNWVRLLLHFVDVTKTLPIPKPYSQGDALTGFCWLDPIQVMQVLRLDQKLSPGMQQIRNWFLARLYFNIKDNTGAGPLWSDSARKVAKLQINQLIEQFGLTQADMLGYLLAKDLDAVYSNEFKS